MHECQKKGDRKWAICKWLKTRGVMEFGGEFQSGKSWYTPPLFSQEWQTKELQDTENERVRKALKRKDEELRV
jgi:hypothetical protein